MKWDKDPLKYEKYLVMDCIIKFSQECEGKDFGQISIKTLHEFIDKFFEKWANNNDSHEDEKRESP